MLRAITLRFAAEQTWLAPSPENSSFLPIGFRVRSMVMSYVKRPRNL